MSASRRLDVLPALLAFICALAISGVWTALAVPSFAFDYDAPAAAYDDAGNLVSRVAGGHGRPDVLDEPAADASAHSVASSGYLSAPRAPQQVIVDTNAVLNRPGVQGALGAGEVPVMTGTTQAELANLVAGGRIKMPHFASEFGVIDDVMDVNTRINIRGMLEAMRRGQPGLFGDGAIGATAVRTGSPVITADRNFAAVLRALGVEVRVP